MQNFCECIILNDHLDCLLAATEHTFFEMLHFMRELEQNQYLFIERNKANLLPFVFMDLLFLPVAKDASEEEEAETNAQNHTVINMTIVISNIVNEILFVLRLFKCVMLKAF